MSKYTAYKHIFFFQGVPWCKNPVKKLAVLKTIIENIRIKLVGGRFKEDSITLNGREGIC